MAQIARNVAELRALIKRWRSENKTIGFVPTMGALHEGHMTLIRAARRQCDHVVVSIFVNPLQFGEGEDFEKYPRQEESDLALLAEEQVGAVYLPTQHAIYPNGYAVMVQVNKWSDILCAVHRPRHFEGVATVVLKLLLQVVPDKAFFGEKDYQQLMIIRLMAAEFHLPVQIIGVPTARGADGLALSSRNAYLNEQERRTAPILYETLMRIASKAKGGRNPVYYLIKEAKRLLLSQGFSKVDYLEMRDAATLDEVTNTVIKPSRLLAAVYLGNTRLIDNIEVLP